MSIKCEYCGNPIPPGAATCPSCGAAVPEIIVAQTAALPSQPARPVETQEAVSPKSRTTYRVLAFLFGTLGIHNFWCGRNTIAWIQLCVTIGSAILCAIGSTDIDPYDGESLGPAVWIWAVVEMFVVKYDGCHRLMK